MALKIGSFAYFLNIFSQYFLFYNLDFPFLYIHENFKIKYFEIKILYLKQFKSFSVMFFIYLTHIIYMYNLHNSYNLHGSYNLRNSYNLHNSENLHNSYSKVNFLKYKNTNDILFIIFLYIKYQINIIKN